MRFVFSFKCYLISISSIQDAVLPCSLLDQLLFFVKLDFRLAVAQFENAASEQKLTSVPWRCFKGTGFCWLIFEHFEIKMSSVCSCTVYSGSKSLMRCSGGRHAEYFCCLYSCFSSASCFRYVIDASTSVCERMMGHQIDVVVIRFTVLTIKNLVESNLYFACYSEVTENYLPPGSPTRCKDCPLLNFGWKKHRATCCTNSFEFKHQITTGPCSHCWNWTDILEEAAAGYIGWMPNCFEQILNH